MSGVTSPYHHDGCRGRPAIGGSASTTAYFYNALGQLVKMTQTGLADTLYTYDALGNQNGTSLDMPNGRVTSIDSSYHLTDGNVFHVTTNGVGSSGAMVVISQQSEQLSGVGANTVSSISTTDASGHATLAVTSVNLAGQLTTTTTTVPYAANPAVQVSYNGLLVSVRDRRPFAPGLSPLFVRTQARGV